MTRITELTKAALLGTRRAKPPTPLGDDPLQRLLAQLENEGSGKQNPAHTLLSMAGAAGLYEQVGQIPVHFETETAVAVSPPDDIPACSPQAARHLQQMLGGSLRALLPEFLAALTKAGNRIPVTLLPNLLAHGVKYSAIRPQILPVIGQNGRWLATQNPEWAYAAATLENWSAMTRHWQQITIIKRQALLGQLRLTDPERGRELLNIVWKTENDASRLRLIKAMENGLALADEPFLEMVLDDRSHLVRRRAAELLAHLPASRLCQRMAQNALKFLSWTPQYENQITLSFPPVTPQMVRDGVVGAPGNDPARIRSQQLIQMVSAVPLTFSTQAWKATPEEIIDAIPTTRWTRTLTAGFSLAARRQKNSVWAKTILQQLGFGIRTNKLITVLTIADCQSLVEYILARREKWEPLHKENPLYSILHQWSRAWDVPMALLWLETIAEHARFDTEPVTNNVLLRATLLQFARNCPPQLADEAAQILLPVIETNNTWRSSILEMIRILHVRRDMLAAINQTETKSERTTLRRDTPK